MSKNKNIEVVFVDGYRIIPEEMCKPAYVERIQREASRSHKEEIAARTKMHEAMAAGHHGAAGFHNAARSRAQNEVLWSNGLLNAIRKVHQGA